MLNVDLGEQLEIAIWLVIASVLGAAIGLERELHAHPAVQPHLLVSSNWSRAGVRARDQRLFQGLASGSPVPVGGRHTNRPRKARDGEVGIHFDYSIPPVLRSDSARPTGPATAISGCASATGGSAASTEGTAVRRIASCSKARHRFKLPNDLWLANRLRVDVRDANEERSNRYRYRIAAEEDSPSVSGWPFVPYAQAESFYNTRFADLDRQRYQTGVEVELDRTWRIESYYAYDKDTKPTRASVNRLAWC